MEIGAVSAQTAAASQRVAASEEAVESNATKAAEAQRPSPQRSEAEEALRAQASGASFTAIA